MTVGNGPIPLALTWSIASALAMSAVRVQDGGGAPPPDHYRDRVIAASSLPPLPPDEDAPDDDANGPPRSFYAEAIISRSERGDDVFDEQGIALGGFLETQDWGTLSLDGTVFNSNRGRFDGVGNGGPGDDRSGLGGAATLWQRNLHVDGDWRIDNGLGVLNTLSTPLQRNQYRFYLPTVAFAGASSEWSNARHGLLLQGSFGRAGIYDGTRIVGFEVADGDVASLGAQWAWAPQWTGTASLLGTHGRIVPDDQGEAIFETGDTQAVYAATAWQGAQDSVQLNLLASDGDFGQATGAWIDASARRGRYLHNYGAYRLAPDLAWGALAINNDVVGGYYRIAYQYARWSWNGGVDRIRSISGNGFDGSYATGFARYQANSTLGYGGNLTLRHSPDTANSAQVFVDKRTDWGQTRVQLDQAHAGRDSDSWQVSLDQAFPLREGARLSASIAYGVLNYATVTAGNDAGSTRTATVSLYGGRDLSDRLSIDGNARWTQGRGAEAMRGSDFNLGLNWRFDRHWSATAALYQSQGSQRSPFILDPLVTGTPFISLPRDRSLFLSLRHERSAGRSHMVIGGASDGPTGAIAGSLFLDDNADGVRAASEQAAANVTVLLDSRYAIRTDSLGNFAFPRVATGLHTLTVIPDNLPLPWSLDGATAQRTVRIEVRQTLRIDIGARRQR
ncbi:MAG: hypothetical protein ACREO8_04560 [Luteimonas sp.]